MLNKISAFIYKNIASILVLIMSMLASYFIFAESYIYLYHSFKELFLQLCYNFCEMFGIEHSIVVPILTIPDVTVPHPILPPSNPGIDNIITNDFDLAKVRWNIFCNMFLTGKTYQFYGYSFLNFFLNLLKFVCFISPIIILLAFVVYYYFKHYFNENINNNYDIDTKPLMLHKKLSKTIYQPLIKYFKCNYNQFFHTNYFKIFLVICLFNYNIISCIVELLVFIFNFYGTFSFANIDKKIYKMFIYLKPLLIYFPWWIALYFILKKMNKLRFEKADNFMYHYDNRNKGVINSLPTLFLTKGGPGSGKDFLGTDIALTREAMWKYKCKENILKYDTMFPNFNFLMLALYVEDLFINKQYKSLTALKAHFKARQIIFNIKSKNIEYSKDIEDAKNLLFGYDYKNNIMEYCDGIKYISLFSVIENYAQFYFIYLMDSTLITNYSVRQDNYKVTCGNMVEQVVDYFSITPDLSREVQHYSNIMNQDAFRLFHKIDCNDKTTFEFGNVAWTEIDKDYGNQIDTEDQDKSDINANTKNDGLYSHFKMIRSSATIDNNLFASVSSNSQRDMNVAINIRDISDILLIKERYPVTYCYLFSSFEMKLFDWITSKYKSFYDNYRFFRGDNTYLAYMFKFIYSKIFNHFTRLQNQYGYYKYDLMCDDKELSYYCFTKKICANRYKTDVYNKYFSQKIFDSKTGILDMTCYKESAITTDEMPKVKSYFFNDLYNHKNNSNSNKNIIKKDTTNKSNLTSMQKRLLKQ